MRHCDRELFHSQNGIGGILGLVRIVLPATGPPKSARSLYGPPLLPCLGFLSEALSPLGLATLDTRETLNSSRGSMLELPAYQGIFSLFGKQPAGRARHQFVRASRRDADRGWNIPRHGLFEG